MVQLIVGKKGEGKTKVLLDKVNAEVKQANGTLVYLDKSRKHMFELNNKVRLIDMSEYDIQNSSEFVGFLSGIVSQDNDLEKMYLDSFLKISRAEEDEIGPVLDRLEAMGEKYQVSFIVSISIDEADLYFQEKFFHEGSGKIKFLCPAGQRDRQLLPHGFQSHPLGYCSLPRKDFWQFLLPKEHLLLPMFLTF